MKTTYIYAIVDPADEWEIRYVGKAGDPEKRLRQHLCEALKPTRKQHNLWKCGWLNKVLAEGRVPKLIILDKVEYLDKDDWQYMEREFIAQYQAEGHRLTNLCKGGEGFDSESMRTLWASRKASGQMPPHPWLGRKHTEETKAKIRASKVGQGLGKKATEETKAKLRAVNIGRKHTEEAIAKMRAALVGKPGRQQSPEEKAKRSVTLTGHKVSEETKAKIGAAHAGRVHSAETRAKVSAAGIGRKHSEEAKAKMRAAKTGHEVSDEARAKISAAGTGRKPSAETRAKIAAAGIGRYISPESLAKRSASMKATLAKKRAAAALLSDSLNT